jgi:hypothetical protein
VINAIPLNSKKEDLMKSLIQTLIALSIAGLLLGGCQKKEEAPADAPAADTAAPAGNATPAEPAPEPTPAEPGGWVPPADQAAPAAPADGAAAPAAPAEEAK